MHREHKMFNIYVPVPVRKPYKVLSFLSVLCFIVYILNSEER